MSSFPIRNETLPQQALPASRFVEKPEPSIAPSCLAAVGRYILDPEVFEVLRGTGEGVGGEI